MSSSNNTSTVGPLILAAALAVGVAYAVPRYINTQQLNALNTIGGLGGPTTSGPINSGAPGAVVATAQTTPGASAAGKTEWLTSAPGRIEPNGGEIRVSSQMPGRVAEVLASVNDTVREGDVLVRLDDDDLTARLMAAEAEAAVRRRERDQEKETLTKPQQDRRTAEDAAYVADRTFSASRIELDRLIKARRTGGAKDDEIQKAREALKSAREKAEASRVAVRRLGPIDIANAPGRMDSGLSTARAEVAMAEAALERSRVRAPADGTVLQIYAKTGESAAPSIEMPLLVFGDTTKLQVRAEIEERDAGKIRIGQKTIVRSDAFPGKSFDGSIKTVAQALGSSRISAKGPRKPNDVDVLEVLIELDGRPQLMSGMRVDVFVKPDASVNSEPAPQTKTN
jgi:HlyD family secretion protein